MLRVDQNEKEMRRTLNVAGKGTVGKRAAAVGF